MKQNVGMALLGHWKFTLRDINTGAVRVLEYKNLIPIVGRAQINKALSGGIASEDEIKINYSSLGDDATPPANGDTALGNETFRKLIASLTYADNQLFATAFYAAAEAVDHHYEAGLHINGTGVADSGVLFSHVAIDVDKANTETLTIDYTLTITNS